MSQSDHPRAVPTTAGATSRATAARQRQRWLTSALLLGCLLAVSAPCPGETAVDGDWVALIDAHDSSQFHLLHGEMQVMHIGLGAWGPNWGWSDTTSHGKATEEVFDQAFPVKLGAKRVMVKEHAQPGVERTLTYQFDLSADDDVPLTMLILSLRPEARFAVQAITLTDGAGKTSQIPVPVTRGGFGSEVARIDFSSKQQGDIVYDISPPRPVSADGEIRLALASGILKKGVTTTTVTITFPGPVALAVTAQDIAKRTVSMAGPDWFPLAVVNDNGPSVIGCEDWLEHPAGRHGGVRITDDHFQFEDGTRVKFWGTNLAYTGSAPSKADADFTSARFAKYGINCLRMHKFTDMGGMGIGDSNDATKMIPAKLDQLDYFAKQLSDHGVYYGWSHTYHFKIGAGNVKGLAGGAEIMKNLGGDTYGLINYAEDVQDLLIQRTVKLLSHVNPYTSKPYSQDPALAFIELQNEDDIFFYTTSSVYGKCPTYRRLLMQRFSDWLTRKYATQEALATAWAEALGGQSLQKRSIEVETNPWFSSSDHLPQLKGGARQRMLDNAAFLHDVQDAFYQKFVKAIRDAGYQGPLLGSPWQAPAMLPHLYNLKSDAEVGYIDRHNYTGGFQNSMLTHPGSGYFSSGLQQVAGRPFALSEWCSVYPCSYAAEGPVLVAAYGLGLQGWDASYEFQSSNNDAKTYNRDVGSPPWDVWTADLPNQIGQAPVLARMIDRGDVKEGDVISVRHVSSKNLLDGEFDFTDQVKQQGDIKTFAGSTPPEALAAGRVLVDFSDTTTPSSFPDMSQFTSGQVITSSTKQLRWDHSGKGFFTIDTPGTKGAVGFVGGRVLDLTDVSMTIDTGYASVLITSLDQGKVLADCRHALISATARECNTGFAYASYDMQVLGNGKPPILLEPVKATIGFSKRAIAAVQVLDQDGRRTPQALLLTDGTFTIDESSDKTFYYEVVFK